MNWRMAKSLVQMRSELDTAYPKRDRTSDGGIGDAAHASRNSDHNPWVKDHNGQSVVTAIDVDRDIAPGFTSRDLAEWLRQRRDQRTKYVISKGEMFSAYANGSRKEWQWGPYTGKNSHTEHMHISVSDKEPLYDNQKPWGVGIVSSNPIPAPAPKPIIIPSIPTIVAGRPDLRLGSAGSDVAYLQRMIGKPEGYTGKKWDDGDFGPQTRDRVKAVQVKLGIDPTGVVDAPTWAAIED